MINKIDWRFEKKTSIKGESERVAQSLLNSYLGKRT